MKQPKMTRYFLLLMFVVLSYSFVFTSLEVNAPDFKNVDTMVRAASDELFDFAEQYLNAHPDEFPNKAYITVVDYSLPSSQPRMYVKNRTSGVIRAIHVAHGAGSDPENTGTPIRFSDANGTHESSLGFYRVSETFSGTHGIEIALDGLSPTNLHARERAILIHSANYVYDTNLKAGMSWGCFAISQANHDWVISALKGGSLMYVGQGK
jgi:hypothetical protein